MTKFTRSELLKNAKSQLEFARRIQSCANIYEATRLYIAEYNSVFPWVKSKNQWNYAISYVSKIRKATLPVNHYKIADFTHGHGNKIKSKGLYIFGLFECGHVLWSYVDYESGV